MSTLKKLRAKHSSSNLDAVPAKSNGHSTHSHTDTPPPPTQALYTSPSLLGSGGGSGDVTAPRSLQKGIIARRGKKKNKRVKATDDALFQPSRSDPIAMDALVLARLQKLRPSVRKAAQIAVQSNQQPRQQGNLIDSTMNGSMKTLEDNRDHSITFFNTSNASLGPASDMRPGDQDAGPGSPSTPLDRERMNVTFQALHPEAGMPNTTAAGRRPVRLPGKSALKQSSTGQGPGSREDFDLATGMSAALGARAMKTSDPVKKKKKGVSFKETVDVTEVDMDASVAQAVGARSEDHWSSAGSSALASWGRIAGGSGSPRRVIRDGETYVVVNESSARALGIRGMLTVEQNHDLELNEDNVTVEYIHQLEEAARDHERRIAAAKTFMERNKVMTAEKRAKQLAKRAMELSQQAQLAREQRVETQKEHLRLQQEKDRTDDAELQAKAQVHQIEKKRELEKIAMLQLQLDELRKTRKQHMERAVETEARKHAISDQLKTRDTRMHDGISSILEHAEVLKQELESGSYDEKQLTRYARSLISEEQGDKAAMQAFVETMMTERRVKRDEERYQHQQTIRQLNHEKLTIDRELAEVARRRQVLNMLEERGIDLMEEIELGHAPPMDLVVTNWLQDPNCPPIEETEEVLSIPDLTSWLRHNLPQEQDKVAVLREEWEATVRGIPAAPYQYRGEFGLQTYDRMQLPVVSLVSSVVSDLIDSALDNVVDVPSEQVIELNYQRWLTRVQQHDLQKEATAWERGTFSIAHECLTELVQEAIDDIYHEMVTVRDVSVELADQYVWGAFEGLYGKGISRTVLQKTIREMRGDKQTAGRVFVGESSVPSIPLIAHHTVPAHTSLRRREREWFAMLEFTATVITTTKVGTCTAIRIAPTGHHFAVGTSSGGLHVYDLRSAPPRIPAAGKNKQSGSQPTKAVTSVNDDSSQHSFELLRTMPSLPFKPYAQVISLSWSLDGQQVVTLDSVHRVRMWFTLADQSSADSRSDDPTGAFVPPGPSMIASLSFPETAVVEHVHNTNEASTGAGGGSGSGSGSGGGGGGSGSGGAEGEDPIAKAERDAKSFPTFATAVPAFSLAGTTGSMIAGLRNGEIVKCNIDALSKAHVAGQVLTHQHRYPSRVPSSLDPKAGQTIGISRELFRSHTSAIIFVGFINNDPDRMVSVDTSGMICSWEYSQERLSTFGWFKPVHRQRLDLKELTVVTRRDDRAQYHFPNVASVEEFNKQTLESMSIKPGWRVMQAKAQASFRRLPLELAPAQREYVPGGGVWETYLPHGTRRRVGAIVRAHKVLMTDQGEFVKHLSHLTAFREDVGTIARVQLTPSGKDLVIMLTFAEKVTPRLTIFVYDLHRRKLRPVRIDSPFPVGLVPEMAIGPVIACLGTDFVYVAGKSAVRAFSLATGQPLVYPALTTHASSGPMLAVSKTHQHIIVGSHTSNSVTVWSVNDQSSPAQRMLLAQGPRPRKDTAPLHAQVRNNHWSNPDTANVEQMCRASVLAWVNLASEPKARQGLEGMWAFNASRREAYFDQYPGADRQLPPDDNWWSAVNLAKSHQALQNANGPPDLDLVTWGHSRDKMDPRLLAALQHQDQTGRTGASSTGAPSAPTTMPSGARTDKSGHMPVNREIWNKIGHEMWSQVDKDLWPKPSEEEWGVTPGATARSERPLQRTLLTSAGGEHGKVRTPGAQSNGGGGVGSSVMGEGAALTGELRALEEQQQQQHEMAGAGFVTGGGAGPMSASAHPLGARPELPVWAQRGYETQQQLADQAAAERPATAEGLAQAAVQANPSAMLAVSALLGAAAQPVVPVSSTASAHTTQRTHEALREPRLRPMIWAALSKKAKAATLRKAMQHEEEEQKLVEITAPQGARAFAGDRRVLDKVKTSTVDALERSLGQSRRDSAQ